MDLKGHRFQKIISSPIKPQKINFPVSSPFGKINHTFKASTKEQSPPESPPTLEEEEDHFTMSVPLKIGVENLSSEELYLLAKQYEKENSDVFFTIGNHIECLKLSSTKGNAEASKELAFLYLTAKYVSQSFNKSAFYTLQGINQGDITSNIWLGRYYEKGLGVQQSDEKAFKCYKEVADAGYCIGCLFIGYCYENGIGVEKSPETSREYYKKAIGKDNLEAAQLLERLGEKEKSSHNNKLAELYFQESFLNFRVLAETGDLQAILKVGECYREGRGIAKSQEVASYYFDKAAQIIEKECASHPLDPNNPEDARDLSTLDLKRRAESGDPTGQYDFAKALLTAGYSPLYIHYLQLAANQNHLQACFELGSNYDLGGRGLPCDAGKAAYYYQKAASLGHTYAQYQMGIFSEHGFGIPQSFEKALDFFKKANMDLSYLKLGQFYENGTGVKKDINQAKEYYAKYLKHIRTCSVDQPNEKDFYACEEISSHTSATEYAARIKETIFLHNRAKAAFGNPEALCKIAKCCEDPFSFQYDLKKAFHYYLLAAHQFYPEADRWLGLLYQTAAFGAESNEIAVSYYKRAIAHGDLWALALLAYCYEQGLGVQQSNKEAENLYRIFVKAAEKPYQTRPNGTYQEHYLENLFDRAQKFLKERKDLAEISVHTSHYSGCSIIEYKSSTTFQDDSEISEEAFCQLKKNADQGDPAAQYRVANCYLEGNGTKKSLEQFEHYLESSAQKIDKRAFYTTGWIYDHGINLSTHPGDNTVLYYQTQSYENAFTYYLKSALAGDLDALATLGYFYEHGLGTTQSEQEAINYYKKAADGGDAWASVLLLKAASEGRIDLSPDIMKTYMKSCIQVKGELINGAKILALLYRRRPDLPSSSEKQSRYFQKAFLLLQEKAKSGDAEAMRQIAQYYASGWGCNPSDEMALQCYLQAITQGNGQAKIDFAEMLDKGKSLGCFLNNPIPLSKKQLYSFYRSPYPNSITPLCKKACESLFNKQDQKALQCILQAVSEDDPVGHYLLGTLCSSGDLKKRKIIDLDMDLDEEALFHFQKAAAAGLPIAQYRFAKQLRIDPIKDDHAAFQYLQKAGDQGLLEARWEVAICYQNGIGVDQSWDKAFDNFKILADTGDYAAQYWVAVAYAFGKGVDVSFEQTFHYLQKSAENNSAQSLWLLGLCHEHGFETSPNQKKAWECYSKAARYGFKQAFYELGRLYQKYVPEGPLFLIPYYYRQGSDKDPRASYALGNLFENGEIVPKDLAKAASLYEKSANQGYAPAQYAIGRYFLDGIETKTSIEKAFHFFALAAKQNYLDASTKAFSCLEQIKNLHLDKEPYLLPLVFNPQQIPDLDLTILKRLSSLITQSQKVSYPKFRIGIEKWLINTYPWNQPEKFKVHKWKVKGGSPFNISEIIDIRLPEKIRERIFTCVKQKAEEGDPDAQYQLAQFYYQGEGVKASNEKYVRYLQLAASHQCVNAEKKLGYLYDGGYSGLTQSFEKAFYYYELATNHGQPCNQLLGYFCEHGLGVPKSYEKAVSYYKAGFDRGDTDCAGYLGRCYELGQGVPKSLEKAEFYYRTLLSMPSSEIYWASSEREGFFYLERNNLEYSFRKFEEAFLYYKAKAFFGDMNAQLKLAEYYLHGYGTEQSLPLAAYCMKCAHDAQRQEQLANLQANDPEDARALSFLHLQERADNGDADAQLQLSNCYRQGVGVEISAKLSTFYLQLSADQGNAKAQYNLAFRYEYGDTNQGPNLEKALNYYILSAEQGFFPALESLGYFYENGILVEKSLEKAIECYQAATDQGGCYGAAVLAYHFEHGIGVPQSIEQAQHYYQLLAEWSLDPSEYAQRKNLTRRTINGVSKQRAHHYCFMYCKVRAEFGDVHAQCEVGNFYRIGRGIGKSLKDAVHYYQLAGEKESPEGLRWLGYLYEHGLYLDQSDEKAIHYYKKAAQLNDSIALSLLGYCFERGKGVPKSDEEAKECYKRAVEGVWNENELDYEKVEFFAFYKAHASLGDYLAQYELAKAYKFGIGTQQSNELFKHNLKLSAEQGYHEAAFTLGSLYDFEDRNYEKAAYYYQEAVNKGHATAKAYLGYLYEHGLGVPQSIEKAIVLYQQAAKQGDPCGLRSLAYCYEEGIGLPMSHELAQDYNRMASKARDEHEAESPDIFAMYFRLKEIIQVNSKDPRSLLYQGDFYHRGIGVRRSDEKTRDFYELAAEQGNEEAKYILSLFKKVA